MTRLKTMATVMVKPANSVAFFATVTGATAKGYAIRYSAVGF